MGYIRHHAILVTSWQDEAIEKAHNYADGMLLNPSNIVTSDINGYRSFFIPPDGSKEGWENSDHGDKGRDCFIEWIGTQAYEDGSSSLVWAEVQYGDENGDQRVLRASEQFVSVPRETGDA